MQKYSRRDFLRVGALTAAGVALAGCVPPTPQVVEKVADETVEVEMVATATPPPAEVKGTFTVWFGTNWSELTDQAIGSIFEDWGKENGVDVEWEAFAGATALLEKESAAVAAGTPPELSNGHGVYWYSQGEAGSLTDLVAKFKDKGGGMYEIAWQSQRAPDGEVFAATYGLDAWMVHWRKDVIEPVTGGGPIETWEQLLEIGDQIQEPPKTFAFAMASGHEADQLANFMHFVWAFGGRLCDEEGKPDIINTANKAGIEMIAKLWEANLIPPDAFAATKTSFNNEAYQTGRGMTIINPPSVYASIRENDPELLENTGLALTPAGSAGAFPEGGGPGFYMHKNAELADLTPSALEYFLEPDHIRPISETVKGRFIPIYPDHTKNDEFWQSGPMAAMADAALNSRTKAWPAPRQPWIDEIQDVTFTMSDLVQKVVNEGMGVEDAQEWAQGECMKAYEKFQG